jgi:hypothetical protein
MTSSIDPTREEASGVVQNDGAERKIASSFSRLPPEVIERYGTEGLPTVQLNTPMSFVNL